MSLKILYHIPHPSSTGADRWICDGWRDAFLDLGHKFYELTAFDDLRDRVEAIKPDIFMTAVNLINFPKEHAVLSQMRKAGTRIFMWVHWPLVPSCQHAEKFLLKKDLVDVYFGEREPEGMADFEERLNKKYYVIPNAANKLLHHPEEPVAKYQYDIVYLGAKLPMKKWFFKNVLQPMKKKYRVGIFGPYWTLKDNFYRFLVKACQKTKFKKGVQFFNKLRIQIPAEDEGKLYSSSKICLNFHERDPDGTQSHIIVNQRTFKISACGGFQICDNVEPIRRYFSEDEVILAKLSAKEWHDLIEYYLTHEEEREDIRKQGTQKALTAHTYHNRVEQLLVIYHRGEKNGY